MGVNNLVVFINLGLHTHRKATMLGRCALVVPYWLESISIQTQVRLALSFLGLETGPAPFLWQLSEVFIF